MDDDSYEQVWAQAQTHNEALRSNTHRYQPTEKETEQYKNLLNISGNGIMGYIEIPAIGVALPIYHGTEDTVLQIAIGHIEGSSLPVGGPRHPTAWFPAIGDCLLRSCSPTWTSWWRAIPLCSVYWTRC